MLSVTCIAPVNIAVIKYWGKRDEDLILPLNDSISATLSTDHLCTKTKITTCPSYKENKIILNGKEEMFENKRLLRCLEEIRKRADHLNSCSKDVLKWNIHVVTENNFPTAAGLASSASGYACLVYTLACLYGMEAEEITSVARLGSGSACRSLYSGFVQWKKGVLDDGSDSTAVQIVPETYWPEMRIIVLVVNDTKKKYSSTSGMSTSVKTSELLKYRVAQCVPKRTALMIEAINNRDFQLFGKTTMEDSNQFHAVCLDTYPPCVYMNDVSHAISDMVHKYNESADEIKVAYTFDAGPNACLYLLEKDVPEVLQLVNHVFPNDIVAKEEYVKGIQVDLSSIKLKKYENYNIYGNNILKYIIHTQVGEGPKRVVD